MQRQFLETSAHNTIKEFAKLDTAAQADPRTLQDATVTPLFFFLQFTRPYASQSYRPFLRVRGRGHTGDGRAPGFAPATIHSRRSQRRKTTRRRGSSTWKARSLTARASA